MEKQTETRGCRIVLAPCPLQGHLNPMLQLGLNLYNSGFSITVIHSTFNSPTQSQYPNFDLKLISNGSSDLPDCLDNPTGFCSFINESCEVPFREYMSELLEGIGEEERVVCIISDLFTGFTKIVAEELGVPRFVFWTSSVNSFLLTSAFPRLRQMGYLPLTGPPSNDPVEGFPQLRVKDLSDKITADQEAWYEMIDMTISQAATSNGIIWNSFEFLEEAALAKIEQDFELQLFTVAPLHQFHSPLPPQSTDDFCIEWLDQQKTKSVIYVSFGSLATLTKIQLLEIAYGLVSSKVPFLWVLRPGLVNDEEHIILQDEIDELMNSSNGLVVGWAPQIEVLAHQSVGGFWTHCGWNSVMESICEGVPMICSPCFLDQNLNARFVSHVWKVGIEVEEEIERKMVEETVRRLMMDEEGEEMRKRAEAFKVKAQLQGEGGDPSQNSFNKFVRFMITTSTT